MKVLVTGASGTIGRAVVRRTHRPRRSGRRPLPRLPNAPARRTRGSPGTPGTRRWSARPRRRSTASTASSTSSASRSTSAGPTRPRSGSSRAARRRRETSSRRCSPPRRRRACSSASRRSATTATAAIRSSTSPTPAGSSFDAQVCVDWEAAAEEAARGGVRLVIMRTGLLLTKDAGLLDELLLPFKLGVGGPVAGGRNYMPWISLDDEVGLLLWALDTPSASGVYNATAPNPVTNREFSKALGRALNRPAVMPVPKLAVKLRLGVGARRGRDRRPAGDPAAGPGRGLHLPLPRDRRAPSPTRWPEPSGDRAAARGSGLSGRLVPLDVGADAVERRVADLVDRVDAEDRVAVGGREEGVDRPIRGRAGRRRGRSSRAPTAIAS